MIFRGSQRAHSAWVHTHLVPRVCSTRTSHRAAALLGLGAVLALSACATSSGGTSAAPATSSQDVRATVSPARPSGASPSAASPSGASPSAASPSGAAPTGGGSSANGAVDPGSLSPPTGPAWHAAPGSTAVQVATLPGGDVSLLWMDPARLRFRVVPGYAVPEGGPATRADSTPATWVPGMIAAFDSGYKLSDHVGGYHYLGRTVAPLRSGLASLVIRSDGSLVVGTWGRDLAMTSDTVMVRQNLPPLVLDGVSRASAADGTRTWGISNGNRPRANRSALGRLPDGSLVFVYAHDVTAAGLADVLVSLGVREAIDLDMNISWPTGFVYSHVGGKVVGQKINPHIVRSPSTYLTRFKKDFVVVQAR